MLAPVMTTPVEDPTSKASVLCPKLVPAELSIVISVTAKVSASLMDINWTGELTKLRPVIEEDLRE